MNLKPEKLNTGPNKAYLDSIAGHVEVYLDGIKLGGVREADTDKGYIIRDVYDETGKLVVEDGDIKQEILTGKVQIKDRRTGKYVA